MQKAVGEMEWERLTPTCHYSCLALARRAHFHFPAYRKEILRNLHWHISAF